jgi:hypothetical protein
MINPRIKIVKIGDKSNKKLENEINETIKELEKRKFHIFNIKIIPTKIFIIYEE